MPALIGALFGFAIALCPPGFRREYGAAMREDFAQAIASEHTLHGWFGTVTYGTEAIADVITTALREYAAMFFRDFVYALRALRGTRWPVVSHHRRRSGVVRATQTGHGLR